MMFGDWWRKEAPNVLNMGAKDIAFSAWKAACVEAVLQEREACAKVCRDQADLRGANDDHKYMADKCAMEIEVRANAEIARDPLKPQVEGTARRPKRRTDGNSRSE